MCTPAQLLSPVQFFATPWCSPPGSSAHGILQARILEWVAISYSKGSSWPRDWTCVPRVSVIAGIDVSMWHVSSDTAVSLEKPGKSLNKFLKSIFKHALKSFSRREPLLSGKFSILYFFLASALAKKASEAEIVVSPFQTRDHSIKIQVLLYKNITHIWRGGGGSQECLKMPAPRARKMEVRGH